jgi:hypothetical protein
VFLLKKEKMQKKFQKQKLFISACSSVDTKKLSLSPTLLSIVLKSLYDLLSVSLLLILWKSSSPKASGAHKSKVKLNMLNWSNKVKIWDLLKG